MLSWLSKALVSSVGRKAVMGLTGLLLVGFLANHLVGNVKLYADEDGTSFNEYVEFLKSFGPLLLVAELGLGLLFAVHLFIALKLTMENREARKSRYQFRNHRGAQTPGSVSMHVTGVLILGYLIKHLLDFRFDGDFLDDPAASVKTTLAEPATAMIYIVASLLVGLHLSHGIKSAFQSLGVSHPKLEKPLQLLAYALAALFALGFASFPVRYMLLGAE